MCLKIIQNWLLLFQLLLTRYVAIFNANYRYLIRITYLIMSTCLDWKNIILYTNGKKIYCLKNIDFIQNYFIKVFLTILKK